MNCSELHTYISNASLTCPKQNSWFYLKTHFFLRLLKLINGITIYTFLKPEARGYNFFSPAPANPHLIHQQVLSLLPSNYTSPTWVLSIPTTSILILEITNSPSATEELLHTYPHLLCPSNLLFLLIKSKWLNISCITLQLKSFPQFPTAPRLNKPPHHVPSCPSSYSSSISHCHPLPCSALSSSSPFSFSNIYNSSPLKLSTSAISLAGCSLPETCFFSSIRP